MLHISFSNNDKNPTNHMTSGIFLPVPGVGLEPTRIAPMVFETIASTNSATRAICSFLQK